MRYVGTWVKSLALVLALVVLGPAQAALIVTITATGTIGSGDDFSGELTGAAGSSLTGQTVTLVQTLEAGPLASIDTVNDPSLSFFDVVSMSVTIGAGAPQLFAAAPGNGGASYGLDTASGLLDSQMTILLGTDALTSIVSVLDGLITQATPLHSFSLTGGFALTGSFFSADRSDDQGNTLWALLVNDSGMRSIVVDVRNDVPEPGGLVLVSLGLVVVWVGRARRRGVGGCN